MINHTWIDGCRYSYDEGLYAVIIVSLKREPYKEGCYTSNALFHKSLAFANKSLFRCRMEMMHIAQKVCPGLVFHAKDQVFKKDSGFYDSERIVYKVGSWEFRDNYYSGFIKPIGEEIQLMHSYGEQYAESLMTVLLRKGIAEQLHLVRMTSGIPRCHYPLLHTNKEYDGDENEYWLSRKDIEAVNMPRYYTN